MQFPNQPFDVTPGFEPERTESKSVMLPLHHVTIKNNLLNHHRALPILRHEAKALSPRNSPKIHRLQAVEKGLEPLRSDSIRNSISRLCGPPVFRNLSHCSAPSRQEGVSAVAYAFSPLYNFSGGGGSRTLVAERMNNTSVSHA